jgi:hypothetical protein
MNGRNIPFVNNVKYLGVIFDKNIIWRLHIKTIEAKAFRAFTKTYSLLKSDRLSTNFKLTLHKALTRSVMTSVCPAWEFEADTPKKQTPWSESTSELYRPSDRRLSVKLVPTFAGRRCQVVSEKDPYGRILGFLDRGRYLFFQIAPQLYSRG